jgi:hypothetical protein
MIAIFDSALVIFPCGSQVEPPGYLILVFDSWPADWELKNLDGIQDALAA